jgi:hypothetical protein
MRCTEFVVAEGTGDLDRHDFFIVLRVEEE